MAGLGNPFGTGARLAEYAKQATGTPQSALETAYAKMEIPIQNVGSAMAIKGTKGGELVSREIGSADQLASALQLDSSVGSSGYSNGYYDEIKEKNPVVGLSGIDFGRMSNEDLHAYLTGAFNNG